MKVLVLTSEPITGQQLRDTLPTQADPTTAIEDALKTFPADRIVVFTHEGEDQRYREDLDRDDLAGRFGLPVDHATV